MPFDELHASGQIRPIYRKHYESFLAKSAAERTRGQKLARARLSGDADFLPLVRLISATEYAGIVRGVKQRGRALQLFLADHYLGGRSYERAGVISKTLVQRIAARYPLSANQPALRRENIQFWYAPDLIRDEDGKFRVLEDNVGLIGGIGDFEAFVDASAALGFVTPNRFRPRSFYRGMLRQYERMARARGGGKVILLSYPKHQSHIHEDSRLAQALGDRVTPVSNFRTLSVQDDGLYHLGERVGFVIINISPDDIEPRGTSPYRIRNFWRAVNEGLVGVSNAPGLEIAGDKQLSSAIKRLIRFYLNEECLLDALPSRNFTNDKSISAVAKERAKWVIKSCRGQSGEAVWVGRHTNPRAWANVIKRVRKKPADFIAQEYCEPSTFLGHPVDLRPIAIIAPGSERVSPFAWGRAARRNNGKTNIARGGLFAPVMIT